MPFLPLFEPFRKEGCITKSYEGSKKNGIDILSVLFQSTLWFVALNLPLLKYSKANPVFTISAFLLNGTSYHFLFFLFWTCNPPFLSWYSTVNIPLSTCVSQPRAIPSCFEISTGFVWLG